MESNGNIYTAGFMTNVTCRLTAKNRNKLRNPTLGNRVWATFFNIVPCDLRETADRATWESGMKY